MRMPEISRARALTYGAAALAALALGGRSLVAEPGGRAASPAQPTAELEAETAEPRRVVVHVVGAVRRPGLYRLVDGSRVDDAIRHAGGASARAELALVNLAAPVADGQQVIVPTRARGSGSAVAPTGSPGASAPTAPVHLNSATLEELDALPGIGPITAQKILFSDAPFSGVANRAPERVSIVRGALMFA